jgi:hypothetical protein
LKIYLVRSELCPYIWAINEQRNVMSRFQILGINDDRDFCECCGKQGLKRVVWIQDNELSEVKHFGTVCATQPAKGFGPAVEKAIKSAVRRASELQKSGWSYAFRSMRTDSKVKDHGWFRPANEAERADGHFVAYTEAGAIERDIRTAYYVSKNTQPIDIAA